MNKKKKIVLIIILFILTGVMFAKTSNNTGNTPSNTEVANMQLKTVLVTILSILSSWWMNVIYLAGIIGIAISMIVTRDSSQAKKKLVGWLFSIIIMASLTNLTQKLFEIKDNLSQLTPINIF